MPQPYKPVKDRRKEEMEEENRRLKFIIEDQNNRLAQYKSPEYKICAACGNRTERLEAKFCPKCGSRYAPPSQGPFRGGIG